MTLLPKAAQGSLTPSKQIAAFTKPPQVSTLLHSICSRALSTPNDDVEKYKSICLAICNRCFRFFMDLFLEIKRYFSAWVTQNQNKQINTCQFVTIFDDF